MKNSRIFIAGDKSMLGAALIRELKSNGSGDIFGDSLCGLELTDQQSLRRLFEKEKPEYVIFAYPKSGGINANLKYPADLIYGNLLAQANLIHYSSEFGVKKLIFFAASCVYPVDAFQPLKEECLLSGRLEQSSEMYAIAKLAGIKMCQAYRRQYKLNCVSVVPATIYGPGDDFDPESSHVLPALIRKFHHAKVNKSKAVVVGGTGKARREFIYLNDLVAACMLLMDRDVLDGLINVGSTVELSIKKLSRLVGQIVGYQGKIIFDRAFPDGVARKLLDSGKITALGWRPETALEEGIRLTYDWYKSIQA